MKIEQVKVKLQKLGFEFLPRSRWGQKAAEPLDVGKNHFTPKFRDVFIGEVPTGFYITSAVVGNFRGFRCHHTTEIKTRCVCGAGTTLGAAWLDFKGRFSDKKFQLTKSH